MNIAEQTEIFNNQENGACSGFERNLAFIIGIDNYQNGISPLKTAVNDAKKLIEVLRSKHKYQAWICLDSVATLNNINQFLEETLPAQVTENDRLLFYFAGHGVALNGDDGPVGYLIPQDAKLGDTNSYLPMTKLHSALSELPCRHFLGILDCCFAGAFRWSSTRDLLTDYEVIYQERYDRFIRDAAWQIITSSASDQKALDNFNLDTERGQVGNHSPFAAALLDALKGAADIYPLAKNGKQSGDGVITATKLYTYLRDRVEIYTGKHRLRQTPGIWCLNKHDKGEYIFLSPNHELNLPSAPPLDESQNPYRGLQAFEEEHSQLFFGREVLTEQLYQHVCQHPFTVVLGASGTGKSSLVKAGLIPYIKNNQLPWHILTPMRPGEAPLKTLNNTISQTFIENWLQQNTQSKLLLVIDQGEELLTVCRDDQEREDFLHLLTNLVTNNADNLRIMLIFRQDFESQLSHSSLKTYWHKSRFIVPPMTRSELRACIEEPASARVMYFEPYSLVDSLIDEVIQMPGALPLLSFALSELYLLYLKSASVGIRSDRVITQADYEELGGVTSSLTQRADREYDGLVKKDTLYAQTIRKLMLRMVAVGGEELARRRVVLSELEYPESENTRIHEVIRRFSDARLLVEGQDAEGKPYVEPAHDALVQGWSRLELWKPDEKESIILQRRLTPAAVEWQNVKNQTRPTAFSDKIEPKIDWLDRRLSILENVFSQGFIRLIQLWQQYSQSHQQRVYKKPTQFLWNANPYLDVLNWQLNSQENWFNKLEIEFIQKSVLQKRRNTSLRWRLAIAVIFGLTVLTFIALWNLRVSKEEEAKTFRKAAEIELQDNQSLNGMIEILRAGKTLEHPLLKFFPPDSLLSEKIEGTLQRAVYTVREHNRFEGYERPVRNVTFSPDGQQLATSGDDGTARLWSTQGKQLQKLLKQKGSVRNIKFSPTGKLVATAGDDGMIRLWNLQGQLVKEWNAQQGKLWTLEFNIDGIIASAGDSGTVRLWNSQGQLLAEELKGHQKPVTHVSFSPNGQLIASGDDGGIIRLWNSQGQELGEFIGYKKSVHGLNFSRDGQELAAVGIDDGEDDIVRIWLVDSNLIQQPIKTPTQALLKQPIIEWNAGQGRLWDVVFNPNNQQLATAGGNGTVKIWNLEGQELEKFVAHKGPVRSVSFSPNGQQLASSSDDTMVRIWNLQNRAFNYFNNSNFANIVSFGANDRQIISGNKDGTISFWNMQGQEEKQAFPTNSGSVESVALSKDGQKIVSSSNDGKISLWNLQFLQSGKSFPTNASLIRSLALSPDGNQIVGGSDDGKIYLWSLQGQMKQKPFEGHLGAVNSVAFSKDGKQIVSGGDDGTVRLWGLDGKWTDSFQVYGPKITAVTFTPDEKSIISSDSRGRIQIWNLKDLKGQLPFSSWSTQQPAVKSISLSADGKQLTTIGSDGSIKSWSIKSSNELIQQVCNTVKNYLKNNLSQSERNLCP